MVLVAPGGCPGVRAERKGPLSTPSLSRASVKRQPDPISEVRNDTDEMLRLVLDRLDDMKAEDITQIDLRGKSAIADHMVVASGTSNRHVGAIADRVIDDLRKAGIAKPRVE